MPKLATFDQPAPVPNDNPAVVDHLISQLGDDPTDKEQLLINDLLDRKLLGIDRYGIPLQMENGRGAAIDLYQELLDAILYAHQKGLPGVRDRLIKEALLVRTEAQAELDELAPQ